MSDDKQRNALLYRAKLAQKVELFDDFFQDMKTYAKHYKDLSKEERNLMSVAFNRAVLTPRDVRRLLDVVPTGIRQENDEVTKAYIEKINKQGTNACDDILSIMEDLIASCKDDEAKVLYLKMTSQYTQLLSGFQYTEKESLGKVQKTYEEANALAGKVLKPTDVLRLDVALAYSTFVHDALKDSDMAIKIATTAFEDGMKDYSSVSDENYSAVTEKLSILRNSTRRWNNPF